MEKKNCEEGSMDIKTYRLYLGDVYFEGNIYNKDTHAFTYRKSVENMEKIKKNKKECEGCLNNKPDYSLLICTLCVDNMEDLAPANFNSEENKHMENRYMKNKKRNSTEVCNKPDACTLELGRSFSYETKQELLLSVLHDRVDEDVIDSILRGAFSPRYPRVFHHIIHRDTSTRMSSKKVDSTSKGIGNNKQYPLYYRYVNYYEVVEDKSVVIKLEAIYVKGVLSVQISQNRVKDVYEHLRSFSVFARGVTDGSFIYASIGADIQRYGIIGAHERFSGVGNKGTIGSAIREVVEREALNTGYDSTEQLKGDTVIAFSGELLYLVSKNTIEDIVRMPIEILNGHILIKGRK